jgi:TPR repeat protein
MLFQTTQKLFHNLGLMYLGGKGTNKDTKKAKKYFKKACDGGIKEACEYFSIVW